MLIAPQTEARLKVVSSVFVLLAVSLILAPALAQEAEPGAGVGDSVTVEGTTGEAGDAASAPSSASSGSAVTMSYKPKDGTLGTDDAILHGVRLVYSGKALT
ncbi:MAG TPA: hypothetical protein PKG82_11040 [Myxococcota bacterium]|nr:hypothetical protein [Myxococcota bacterium]